MRNLLIATALAATATGALAQPASAPRYDSRYDDRFEDDDRFDERYDDRGTAALDAAQRRFDTAQARFDRERELFERERRIYEDARARIESDREQLAYRGATWQGRDGQVYCRRPDGTTGTIIGGVAGGLLGRAIDGGRRSAVGTLLGAGAGALLGRGIEQSNGQQCR